MRNVVDCRKFFYKLFFFTLVKLELERFAFVLFVLYVTMKNSLTSKSEIIALVRQSSSTRRDASSFFKERHKKRQTFLTKCDEKF